MLTWVDTRAQLNAMKLKQQSGKGTVTVGVKEII
jgi:hypothetical protein